MLFINNDKYWTAKFILNDFLQTYSYAKFHDKSITNIGPWKFYNCNHENQGCWSLRLDIDCYKKDGRPLVMYHHGYQEFIPLK